MKRQLCRHIFNVDHLLWYLCVGYLGGKGKASTAHGPVYRSSQNSLGPAQAANHFPTIVLQGTGTTFCKEGHSFAASSGVRLACRW